MDIANEVRPGANRFVSGANILQDLPKYLTDFEKIIIITGEISWKIFNDYYQKELPYPVFPYDGSASDEDAARLAKEIGRADMVIAIGGGRVADTAKLTAELLDCELTTIPTLISNCAPYTPVAAVYHPDHTFKRMGFFKRAPYLCLVDWQFLLTTPKDYLIAGIGDTVAKWYEIEGITRRLPAEKQTAFIRLGIASAKEILTILLADARAAVTSLEEQTISVAFGRITDTIIALAGEVGGFAVSFGRTAGAHAIHNGLSFLPATHSKLHGMKVAYGVLVQLSYTNDFAEIDQLLPFYHDLQLPTKLADINVYEYNQEILQPVTDFAASSIEFFKLIDPEITSEKTFVAMDNLEKYIAKNV
ncbi:putative oxidoreductase [Enterococcus sp. PF1-24]|uniref:iron-containing alcohol dehydrogenase family protein n=1 Tax=unclassified Enterococcus TaxID=2608891 RepID=UPI002475CA65|nr:MULTISPECIES: iron-containing alcohol dehydrogenase family protein [unclassified Enterococcus]MDH6365838.1 putative oxidoreductase [Enterococcus sp. PFB1-1]MDH6402930.1 putative oxidoreductase [Enterococcus sp. PF1-24]